MKARSYYERHEVLSNGTKIYHPKTSVIQDCDFGARCTIHSHVWIGREVKIGDDVKVQAFAFIPDGVTIGNKVFIGPRVTFTNDAKLKVIGKEGWSKTVIEDGVKIGAGALIRAGVTIGKGTVIGMGAVVLNSCPPNSRLVGNPAN